MLIKLISGIGSFQELFRGCGTWKEWFEIDACVYLSEIDVCMYAGQHMCAVNVFPN